MRLLVVLTPDSLSLHTLHTASPWQGSLRLMSGAISAWVTLVIPSRPSVIPPCGTVYVLSRLMLQSVRALIAVRLGAALDCAPLVAFVPSMILLPLPPLLMPLLLLLIVMMMMVLPLLLMMIMVPLLLLLSLLLLLLLLMGCCCCCRCCRYCCCWCRCC